MDTGHSTHEYEWKVGCADCDADRKEYEEANAAEQERLQDTYGD